jgi:hypothetical protein
MHPADSAGWRLKQCSILPAAARRLLVSDTSLGSRLLNQKYKYILTQGPLSLHKRDRDTVSVLNDSLWLHNSLKAEVLPELKLMDHKCKKKKYSIYIHTYVGVSKSSQTRSTDRQWIALLECVRCA